MKYKKEGILYVVSTPIGNLEDITLRALRVLKEVDLILCEDTRKAGMLLKKYEIKKPLLSYFEHNEDKRIREIIPLLKEGKKIALITNAGTPAISDPGYPLVREVVKEGIKIDVCPGASSVISSLVLSCLPTDTFIFLGFPPKGKKKKRQLLEKIGKIDGTYIIFVPARELCLLLNEIYELYGEIEGAVVREQTKIYEEVLRGKISFLYEHFSKKRPKGEITLLVHANFL